MVTTPLTSHNFSASQSGSDYFTNWEHGAGNVRGKCLSQDLRGKYMKRWLCAVGLSLSLGCASAVVRPYVGDQQAWPTASGSIVSTNYSLPVFTSLPPVSYDVLAEMRINSPFYAQPEEGHLPLLVKKAKQMGADALVFVQGRIFFSTNYGPRNGGAQDNADQKAPTLTTVNTFNPDSFASEVTILAVRWTGDAPAGLPSHHKEAPVVATPPVEAPPVAATPAPAQPAPATEASNTDSSATAPAPTATPAPSTSTPPTTPPSQ
jgi:hypothetical protein